MQNEHFSSITEVSKMLDVPTHTLRYWEKQFGGAVRPTTGTGGRRYYRADTVNALRAIRELLYDRGMTVSGVKKVIKDGGLAHSAEVGQESPLVKEETTNSAKTDHAIALLKQARGLLSV